MDLWGRNSAEMILVLWESISIFMVWQEVFKFGNRHLEVDLCIVVLFMGGGEAGT